ncbi:MAG: hypothetical protein ACTS8S_00975 [Giesbergeria sp.]
MSSFAQNRTDLTIIDDVRSKLINVAENLRVIGSEGSHTVDEDYKVATWHSLSIEAMDRLLELAGECEAQSIRVLSGMHVKQTKADEVLSFDEVLKAQKSFDKHLETYVEARKCCELLAHSETQTEQTKKVERLIDPLHMLSEDYAKHYLSHLSEEELARAEETLVAQQARAVLDRIVPAIPPHVRKSLADAELDRARRQVDTAEAAPKEDVCPLPPWNPMLYQYDPAYDWWMYRTDHIRCSVSRAFPQFSGSCFIKDSCGWRLVGEVGGHPSPEHAVEALRGKFMEMKKQAKENQELEHLRVLKRLLNLKDPFTASLIRRGLIEVTSKNGIVLTNKAISLL